MTDLELLEFAAKAVWIKEAISDRLWIDYRWLFDPLNNDGDALRLAVKLGISVVMYPACIAAEYPKIGCPLQLIGLNGPYEDISNGQDKNAATRRAITRAAAEIGREMK